MTQVDFEPEQSSSPFLDLINVTIAKNIVPEKMKIMSDRYFNFAHLLTHSMYSHVHKNPLAPTLTLHEYEGT
jgi:hypothetical protein